jgi:hypothetical protein
LAGGAAVTTSAAAIVDQLAPAGIPKVWPFSMDVNVKPAAGTPTLPLAQLRFVG